MPVLARGLGGRAALRVERAQVGARLEEQLDDLGVAVRGRDRERGLAARPAARARGAPTRRGPAQAGRGQRLSKRARPGREKLAASRKAHEGPSHQWRSG